jgi:tRNA modification GTPase
MSTIFALASGAIPSGVALIRISGPRASHALQALTSNLNLPVPRQLSLRTLHHPVHQQKLDTGMVAWFPSPHSYTGEPVAELHVHGGRAVVEGVMDALATLPSTRMAERGEFTRRAFESGKLDLLQVEAVADIIAADTTSQLQQALHQAGGAVSQQYSSWRAQIIRLLAHVEATIDFGDDEDDVDDVAIHTALVKDIDRLRHGILRVLDDRRGEAIREGIRVAIVGPPNAGKSTLLNLLASKDAAIVSDVGSNNFLSGMIDLVA